MPCVYRIVVVGACLVRAPVCRTNTALCSLFEMLYPQQVYSATMVPDCNELQSRIAHAESVRNELEAR